MPERDDAADFGARISLSSLGILSQLLEGYFINCGAVASRAVGKIFTLRGIAG